MTCKTVPSVKRWLLTMLLMAILLPAISANSNQVIRIGFKDVKLIKTLERIEAVTTFRFSYNREDIDASKTVNIREKEWMITELLDEVSRQTSLSFKIVNGIIAVAPKSKTDSTVMSELAAAEVKGKVTDKSGQGLQGATVKIKGKSMGTATGANGSFTIQAEASDILVISFTGYVTREIAVGAGSLDIVLEDDSRSLNEVVVTALGIRKERRALGYSVTEIKGGEFTQAREVNIANSLVGRVAGLNVSSVSGGPGASSNITIRGISSLTGSNQPLFVINGVPMSNESTAITSKWSNSADQGDGIGNLNPDDIESMSVLKGASASALYGSRAKAGVILITTKSGKGKGTVEFNTNFVGDQALDFTDWQYEFGQGNRGNKLTTWQDGILFGNQSWGAKMDGTNVIQFDSVYRAYVPQRDNLKKFYRIGNTFTNTISFSKGLDNNGGIRFSASDLNNNAITPNSGLKRQTFSLSTTYNVTKRLSIDARASYIIEKAKNRPIINDGAGNANFQTFFMPTTLDINSLKPGADAAGREVLFSNNTFASNPWFVADKHINSTNRNRFIGSASVRYTFDNGLFLQGRVGLDAYTNRNTFIVPSGTAYRGGLLNATVTEGSINFSELNVDGLIGKTFKVNQHFSITPNVGANLRKVNNEATQIAGNSTNIPFIYDLSNVRNQSTSYSLIRQEVQSVFGTIEFNYKGILYLNGGGRNDWFSTLAPNNKLDVFYPSVSTSFIFSELWRPTWLTFGKVRAGYAVVGAAAQPYQTMLNYGIGLSNVSNTFTTTINGKTLGRIINRDIPTVKLRPSMASELEIGTELRFFKNRFGVDFTWYSKVSRDEIVQAPASISSGYKGVVLNIGKLQNRGMEVLLTGTLVDRKDYSWTTSLNGSLNNNTVVQLAEGQASFSVAESRTGNAFLTNVVGLPVNQIQAYDFLYDAQGQVVTSPSNGAPVQGPLRNYGSGYHKWTGGWNNDITYKKFNFSILIDGKFGGKVYSGTDYYGYGFGLHKETLVGRDKMYGSAKNIFPQDYYGNLRTNITSLFVQDASFIKLRQVTLGYNLPSGILKNVIQSATISLVGRNLLVLMKRTDNIDPEATYSNVAQGLELGGVPSVRSFGVNLNVKL